ncbi:hypothetical protein [Priestia koreensis]|uniref:hypothetical protein n=1 Tax=Priestia koreensis TaxID=284581 RepID=UPI0034593C0D
MYCKKNKNVSSGDSNDNLQSKELHTYKDEMTETHANDPQCECYEFHFKFYLSGKSKGLVIKKHSYTLLKDENEKMIRMANGVSLIGRFVLTKEVLQDINKYIAYLNNTYSLEVPMLDMRTIRRTFASITSFPTTMSKSITKVYTRKRG